MLIDDCLHSIIEFSGTFTSAFKKLVSISLENKCEERK